MIYTTPSEGQGNAYAAIRSRLELGTWSMSGKYDPEMTEGIGYAFEKSRERLQTHMNYIMNVWIAFAIIYGIMTNPLIWWPTGFVVCKIYDYIWFREYLRHGSHAESWSLLSHIEMKGDSDKTRDARIFRLAHELNFPHIERVWKQYQRDLTDYIRKYKRDYIDHTPWKGSYVPPQPEPLSWKEVMALPHPSKWKGMRIKRCTDRGGKITWKELTEPQWDSRYQLTHYWDKWEIDNDAT